MDTFVLAPESTEPATAAFIPSAPFLRQGTFRQSTGELTGSLRVSFLDLKFRLTVSPPAGNLTVESPGQAF